MHEYKLQIDYTGHPATPWNVIVTHHGEKKIYEGSSQSLLFLLNQAGKLIREIEYAERRPPVAGRAMNCGRTVCGQCTTVAGRQLPFCH
jgi:hypothetical protein